MYYLYVLRCSDDTLYTGTTDDIARRMKEHNSSKRGAKYTFSRRPVKLAFSQRFRTKSSALKAEFRLKKLSRAQKLELLSNTSQVNENVE